MPRRHWHLRIADMLDAAETAVHLALILVLRRMLEREDLGLLR